VISILHAYSHVNRGDAFLVSATVDRIRRAGYHGALTVVSLDQDSFGQFGDVVSVGTTRSKATPAVAGAALRSARSVLAQRGGRASSERLTEVLGTSSALVGVGGGYLDCSSVSRQVGVAVNHLPQLIGAARADVPTIYMPQSIGVLNGRMGGFVRSSLEQLDRLWVRDSASLRQVDGPHIERCPDLAVLEVADQRAVPGDRDDSIMLIARRLVDPGDYGDRLQHLAARLPGAMWAVQAGGPPEKSDRHFYQQLGVGTVAGGADVVLSDHRPVVISVRLHGSLMALMDGLATVHLSYEPKGIAAMNDLGLAEWVHPARTFDPDLVAHQVEEIVADPTRYWLAIDAASESLRAASARLDFDLASRIC